MPTTWKQSTLASGVLLGLIVFLYQVAGVLHKITDWEVLWNPPTVGDLLIALAAALVAVAAALGLNVGVLLKGFGVNLGGPPDPPTSITK